MDKLLTGLARKELIKMDDKAPKNLDTTKNTRQSRQTLLVIALVVLAVGVAGVIVYKNRQGNDRQLPTANYSYKNVEKTVVRGNASGKGMSFSRPAEYQESAGESSATKAVFVRLESTNDKNFVSSGRLLGRVQDFNSETGPTIESAQTLKQSFNNPTEEAYQSAAKPVEFTIKNLYSDATVENIGQATPFSNQNITKEAWKFDFSTKGKNGTPDQQGVAVVAIGQKGIYYYAVSAKNADWQNNKSFFDNLLSSIQVDI